MMKTFFETLRNLFKRPVTIRYPFEKTYIPDDYRGVIAFDENLCIWCRRCEMVCPPGAIVFSQDMEGKQTYHYNRAVCIFCKECVLTCPKEGALVQTNQPAIFALKQENINNGWNKLYEDAVKSREAYAAEKKRLQKAVSEKKNEAQQALTSNPTAPK